MRYLPTFRNSIFDSMFDFDEPFFRDAPTMRTDVVEKDNEYVLSVELPGFKKEDLQMKLNDGYLTVSANHDETSEEKDNDGTVIRRERHTGSMSRQFYVGNNVKEEDIKAKFENGELVVDIPKYNAVENHEDHLIAIE